MRVRLSKLRLAAFALWLGSWFVPTLAEAFVLCTAAAALYVADVLFERLASQAAERAER